MLDIKIRAMEERDVDAILEAIEQNFTEHTKFARRDFKRFFSTPADERRQFIVAEANGRAVGCVGFHPDEDEDVQNIFWAIWLYVRPDHHGHGIGGLLWTEMEKRVTALGARKLYMDVGNESDHATATAFYYRRGYVKEGELVDYFREGENKQIFAKRMNQPD